MKIKLLFSGVLSFFLCSGYAQLTIRPELKTALENKNSFREVMSTVTAYYVQNGYMTNPDLFREFKKWNRWAWYEMRHLDQNGNFVETDKQMEVVLDIANQASADPQSGLRMTNGGGWVAHGPSNVAGGIGRVDRLAFHPTDPNQIYAGTPAGGLWHTTNGGNIWAPLNGYTPSLGVSGIIVDSDNPNNLYVLSGDGDSFINGGMIYTRSSVGLLRSTDGGIHWSVYSNIVPPGTTFFGFKLMQSNEIHYLYYACTTDGLYRSNNYGQTWTRNPDIGNQTVFDIEQAENGYIYAATRNRIYISTDWGTSFTIVPNSEFSTPPTSLTVRTSIAVPPNAQNTLYVHFGENGLLYRSTNNGSDFTLMNSSAPTSIAYMASMTVNPSNSNNVLLGSLNVMTSVDGGSTFPNTGAGIHADIHDLAYNPLDNILYAGCDGGVYKSIDNGLNWVTLYNGMNTSQYYHMGCLPGNNGVLIAGAQDNGVHARSAGGSYTLAATGDGFDAKFQNGNTDTAYFSLNAAVFKYTIPTNTNQQVLLPGGNINDQNFFFPHLAIHPTDNKIVYAGYISNIYRSTDWGLTWTTIGNAGSAGFAAAGGLAVSANVPDRLYAANGAAAWRFDNQGANWTLISNGPGWPSGTLTITDIQTRPTNANEVLITFGGFGTPKVVFSSDGGETWANITGGLPDVPAYCAEFTSDGDIYVGTDAGVYFRNAGWSDWIRFSNGLPVLPVTELVVDETNATINAATFGRGIWQSDLYSDCGPYLFLTGLNEGTNFYQSNGFIETDQVLPGSYGNELFLRSPTRITFENGFRAFYNSKVHAVIGNCGQGVLNFGEAPIHDVRSPVIQALAPDNRIE